MNQPVKFNVVTPKVDTLSSERFIDFFDEGVLAIPEHIKYIRETIVEDIASELNNYIDFSTTYQPDLHGYRIYGEIKLVNLKEE